MFFDVTRWTDEFEILETIVATIPVNIMGPTRKARSAFGK